MAISFAPMYDVTKAVGRSSPNLKYDVMLVQYFLFSIYLNSGWPMDGIFKVLEMPPSPKAIFPINGEYDPALIQWIECFQRGANAQGYGPLSVDGQVSHAGIAWGDRQPKAHNRYTIQVMNHMLWRADRSRFWNLAHDSSMPPSLGGELATMRLNHDGTA